MTTAFEIRPLLASELNEHVLLQLNELKKVLSTRPDPITMEHAQRVLGSDRTTIFVAVDTSTGAIVGMSTLVESLQLLSGKCWLEDVAVLPAFGGRRLGTQLTVAVIMAAQHRGLSKLDLTSSDTRLSAQALYERLGWKHRDSALMRLTLTTFNIGDHPELDTRAIRVV